MQHNKIANWGFVVLICLLVNACAGNQGSKDYMSDEKKAALYLQMGVRYLEMDMLKPAKENLELAEQMDANNADTHNALGVLYERMKQYQKTRDQYQQALELDAENAEIKNNYGRYLCERGEYEKGVQLLTQALAMPLNNRKWFAYTNLGRCKLNQGDQQKAENFFRQALQENKAYTPALFEMQKISYRSGKYMSARAFMQRYLSSAKHNSESLWYAVQTERALGNKQTADEYRELLFKLFPASKEADQLKTAVQH